MSAFLVNERKPDAEAGKKDRAFAFQARLALHAPEGFVPRPNLRGLDSKEWDEQVADLQYRDQGELAVGHGVATHATVSADGVCRHVETAWVPAAQVEKVIPGDVPGATPSMLSMDGAPFEAFRLANKAVAHQARRRDPKRYATAAPTWRPFQRSCSPRRTSREGLSGRAASVSAQSGSRPNALAALTPETRDSLVRAFEAGRLSPPYTELSVQRYAGAAHAAAVAAELARLHALGMTPVHVTEVVKLVGGPAPPGASLVWSGPDDVGAETRDTGVVMRELFASATRSVLVVGFALYQGKRIFRVLAERMEQVPQLSVRMCLHIERPKGDMSPAEELVRRFAERFHREQWPGTRLPEVYHDPRTLALYAPGQKRVSLHAKCVVVDESRALVTSANFTEAAQARNIEVGALLADVAFARALVRQVEGLVTRGAVVRVKGI